MTGKRGRPIRGYALVIAPCCPLSVNQDVGLQSRQLKIWIAH
jgi:hypothetical protein